MFSSVMDLEPKDITGLVRQKLHVRSRGMPALFISSLIFSLGHAMVAYLTSCKGRRKLQFHQIDPEAVSSNWLLRFDSLKSKSLSLFSLHINHFTFFFFRS